jgi:hypothetical protein
MRDTLGQDVLFPEGQKPKRPVRRAPPKPVTAPDSTAAPGAEAPAVSTPSTIPGLPGAPSVSVPNTPQVPSAGSAIPTPRSVPTPAVPTPSVPTPAVPAQSGGNAANAGRAPNPFGNLLK